MGIRIVTAVSRKLTVFLAALLLIGAPRPAHAGRPLECKVVARGLAQTADLGVQTDGGPQIVRVQDASAWDKIWSKLHPDHLLGVPRTEPARVPEINFEHHMVLVVLGRPGSAEVHLLGLANRPKILTSITDLAWPGLAVSEQVVPYEADVTYKTELPMLVKESAVSLQLRALVGEVAQLPTPPADGARELTPQRLQHFREQVSRQGNRLLARLWKLQSTYPSGPHIRFTKLLEASLLDHWVHHASAARNRYKELISHYPQTPFAALAQGRLSAMGHGAADVQARQNLDTVRAQMLAQSDVPCERWMELAGEYQYLQSMRPENVYLAAACYLEGGRAKSPCAQEALLSAADLYQVYLSRKIALQLYWRAVVCAPDTAEVPRVLRRMHGLYPPKQADVVYKRYLHAFAGSPQAAAVKRMLPAEKPLAQRPK